MNNQIHFDETQLLDAINSYLDQLKCKPLASLSFLSESKSGKLKNMELVAGDGVMVLHDWTKKWPVITISNFHAKRGDERKVFKAFDFRKTADMLSREEYKERASKGDFDVPLWLNSYILKKKLGTILQKNDARFSCLTATKSTLTVMYSGHYKQYVSIDKKALFQSGKQPDVMEAVLIGKDLSLPAVYCEGVATALTIWADGGGEQTTVCTGGLANLKKSAKRAKSNVFVFVDFDKATLRWLEQAEEEDIKNVTFLAIDYENLPKQLQEEIQKPQTEGGKEGFDANDLFCEEGSLVHTKKHSKESLINLLKTVFSKTSVASDALETWMTEKNVVWSPSLLPKTQKESIELCHYLYNDLELVNYSGKTYFFSKEAGTLRNISDVKEVFQSKNWKTARTLASGNISYKESPLTIAGFLLDVKQHHIYDNFVFALDEKNAERHPRWQEGVRYLNSYLEKNRPVFLLERSVRKHHLTNTFFELVDLFCEGTEGLSRWVHGWVYIMVDGVVNKRFTKLQTSVVISGEKGVGKNAWQKVVESMLGNKYCVSPKPESIQGSYNSIVENNIFVVLQEADTRKHSESSLKSLITEDNIVISKKYVNDYIALNNSCVAILTNEKHAVNTTADERRFTIINVPSKNRQRCKELSGRINAFFASATKRDKKDFAISVFQELKNMDFTKEELFGVGKGIAYQCCKTKDSNQNVSLSNPIEGLVKDFLEDISTMEDNCYTFDSINNYIMQKGGATARVSSNKIQGVLLSLGQEACNGRKNINVKLYAEIPIGKESCEESGKELKCETKATVWFAKDAFDSFDWEVHGKGKVYHSKLDGGRLFETKRVLKVVKDVPLVEKLPNKQEELLSGVKMERDIFFDFLRRKGYNVRVENYADMSDEDLKRHMPVPWLNHYNDFINERGFKFLSPK